MATQDHYQRALRRAHAERLVLIGSSQLDDGTTIWQVANPQYAEGWYSIRLAKGSNTLACNCEWGRRHATPLCKHAALVEEARQANAEQRARLPARRQTAAEIRAERDSMAYRTTDTTQFSLWAR